MTCEKCGEKLDREKSEPNLWKEGDEGLKYKWNKIGEVKDYIITCPKCGEENHWMPL